ncbi:MAG: hypothetical protein KF866_12605 [Phycisphaeraceae bacterium]|nr:hypothetical protein [Phycisphaeraceae bacterium]MCW5754097.1 hypothetical protein [Phycisphaeraceae bacterium]
MTRCLADSSIPRVEIGGFKFPLGVYPIEPLTPRPGYLVEFEPADGGDEASEWEEWPDRYVFDIVITSERLAPLIRSLLSILPPRVYPILDVMGHDPYREIDPYIAYELVGLDRLVEGIRRFRPFLFEDGLCGFGAMCDDPFAYLFVDEHKILTIRVAAEARERVERILKAFDLEQVPEPLGADAAAHEHRSVLTAPPEAADLLTPEEVIERLRDEWKLVLNIDTETNEDDQGNPLGVTPWRCLVRTTLEGEPAPRYAEALLWADGLRIAEETALDAAEEALGSAAEKIVDNFVVSADRLTDAQLTKHKSTPGSKTVPKASGNLIRIKWLG